MSELNLENLFPLGSVVHLLNLNHVGLFKGAYMDVVYAEPTGCSTEIDHLIHATEVVLKDNEDWPISTVLYQLCQSIDIDVDWEINGNAFRIKGGNFGVVIVGLVEPHPVLGFNVIASKVRKG